MDERPAFVPASSEHVLADGTKLLVRPIVPSDRVELEAGYRKLSAQSRHTRFFAPPNELSERDLDYLTQLDYRDHLALGAFALDEPGQPGVAVARYVRDADDPSSAEVAVTVLDHYQRRGIGTLLTRLLAVAAAANEVRTFVYFVQWENDDMIELLRESGARITADEPGVARIELDIPRVGREESDHTLHAILRAVALLVRATFERAQAGAGEKR